MFHHRSITGLSRFVLAAAATAILVSSVALAFTLGVLQARREPLPTPGPSTMTVRVFNDAPMPMIGSAAKPTISPSLPPSSGGLAPPPRTAQTPAERSR